MKNKSRELLDELRTVFAGRNSFLDAILPPILFLLVNGLAGFQAAMWSALGLSVVITAVRIFRKQSLIYALAGVGSVAVAIGIAWFLGKSEGFFLPGLISGSMTLLLTIVSLLIHRPMVAWTSYIARRWPLGLVLASAGATRLQRSDTRVGFILRRPFAPAIFAL
jgi:hypothetical protein